MIRTENTKSALRKGGCAFTLKSRESLSLNLVVIKNVLSVTYGATNLAFGLGHTKPSLVR